MDRVNRMFPCEIQAAAAAAAAAESLTSVDDVHPMKMIPVLVVDE